MVTHNPSPGARHHLEAYLVRLDTLLDKFKHGEISQTELINQHSELVVGYQHQLTEAFVIRMRLLESFRVPRGEHLPVTGGQ